MGKHSNIERAERPVLAVPRDLRRPVRPPVKRPRGWQFLRLPISAFAVAFAIVLVTIVDPYSGAFADEAAAPNHWQAPGGSQTLVVANAATIRIKRDAYGVKVRTIQPASVVSVPAAGIPSPGSAQAIAKAILQKRGMGDDQYSCLVSLWNRESHWSVTAANPSGAYGIPQAKPGNKMASAGPDWQTNAKTQILWGLSYIKGRYSTPCGAWAHSQASGWY